MSRQPSIETMAPTRNLAKASSGPSSPPIGLEREARYRATRVRQLTRLGLAESEAEIVWREAREHRRILSRSLGRDVGMQVALLDYLVNVRPRLAEPEIVARSTLEAIELQAVSDQITGLYNRHYFESELAREVDRRRRNDGILSLVVLDLDNLKHVNDTYGHATGDRIVRDFGEIVRRHVRGADVPCRYGGDEFAVVMPDTPTAVAGEVAERIRTAFARSFNQSGVRCVGTTVSAGVASIPPEPDVVADLFAAADQRLYLAKASGGDRVAIDRTGPVTSRTDRTGALRFVGGGPQ